MAAVCVDYVVCRSSLVPLLVNTMYVGSLAAIKMSSLRELGAYNLCLTFLCCRETKKLLSPLWECNQRPNAPPTSFDIEKNSSS